MPTTTRSSDAAPAMLGYLYQARFALLRALRGLREDPDHRLWIELLDDVVFESGTARELLQTKHHINAATNLTDYSPDLWRTLGNWIRLLQGGRAAANDDLFLVTTAIAATGTAVALLRAGASPLNVADAKSLLDSVAETATSRDTETDRQAYRELTHEGRRALLDRVTVADAAPSALDARLLIEAELVLAVELRWRTLLAESLEGWWFERVIRHLHADPRVPFHGAELRGKLADLREHYVNGNLPISDSLRNLVDSSIDWSEFESEPFVEQLRLFLRDNSKRILFAMRDYYRASEQRSLWEREELLHVGELGKYETRLKEAWDRRFTQMLERLDGDAAESDKKGAAETLYTWVENDASIPIRPMLQDEAFITRGSLHMLADEGAVGWHPEYVTRLAPTFARRGGK